MLAPHPGILAHLRFSRFGSSLSEDGRPQTIRYFFRETNLPLTLGLMVDTSGIQQRVIDAERGACRRFADQVVRDDKDQAFIMRLDSILQMRQDLASSAGRSRGCIGLRRHRIKALIVLSDGVDFGSETTLNDAVEAAERAETLIYSIVYSDPRAYGLFGSGRDGSKVLRRVSNNSGGSFFQVSQKQPLHQIFEVLQQELRNQYSLGYVSDKPVTAAEFRGIHLAAKQSDLTVQARHQYWAKP